MNEMTILLLGVAAGAYFAEGIRKTVSILDLRGYIHGIT